MRTFGSLHLQGAICIVAGCYGCCRKYSHKTSAGLMASQSRPWAGLTHSAACWGKALNVSFYSLSSPAFSLNSLQLSLIPPGSMWMMIWTLIHADVLEIVFNPTCLGRKRSKRSYECSVPGSWAQENAQGEVHHRKPHPCACLTAQPGMQDGFTSGRHALPRALESP